jgi:hypothetical protein
MDAVNKKAISITRIGFIMFQYFHSESSGSGFVLYKNKCIYYMNIYYIYMNIIHFQPPIIRKLFCSNLISMTNAMFRLKKPQTQLRLFQKKRAVYIISYLRVDPWALRLYHPEALLYSLRRSRRLYSGAEGWYNLNVHG